MDNLDKGDGSEQITEKAVDVTERILERRNHSAQVELDLRKLQIELLNNQVDMLNMFLPKSFHTRGGDSDGVNIELLLLRISNKAKMIEFRFPYRYIGQIQSLILNSSSLQVPSQFASVFK